MKYTEARDLIQNGDIISFRRPAKGFRFWYTLITTITRTPYYHTGVAIWLTSDYGNRRLMVVEAVVKRRLTPMSYYNGCEMDVIKCPIDFSIVADDLIEHVSEIKYGYLDFIVAGIKELFKISSKINFKGEICTELVIKMLKKAEFDIQEEIVSPGKLNSILINKHKCEYRCHIGL